MRRTIVVMVVVLILFLTLPVFLAAQQVASLTGVVTDKTGAVLTDATVKLLDSKTNASYETQTNSVGAYTFVKLLPGPGYKLTAAKEGFESVTVSNIYLGVGTTHTQNVQLNIGKVTESIEVSGSGQAVSLNTTDATVGNNFDMRSVHQLPIQVRDSPAALLVLQPGVVDSTPADDPNNSRTGAVTGARIDQGNMTLDGLDVNDFATGQAFVPASNAPVDSIQEFRGETANPLAASGRGSGAQINLVTKSGTNEWHGSASEYHRNTVTEANSFFNIQAGVPRTKLIRNQFGASLGGPIKKDKLFFFFDYEGRRDAREDSVSRVVPLDHVRDGGLAYINTEGDVAIASRAFLQATDPRADHAGPNQALLDFITSRYPRANDLTGASGGDLLNTGGFRFNSPVADSLNDYVTKIDYNLSSKMRVFGRFSIVRENQGDDFNQDSDIQFPGDPITKTLQDQSYAYVLGHTWTISPTKVNQFVYGVTRSKLSFPVSFYPPGTNNFNVFANGGGGTGLLSSPFSDPNQQFRDFPIPVFRDDFTYLRGNHNIQVGGTFKPIRTNEREVLDFNFIQLGLGGGLSTLNSSLRPSDIDPNSTDEWDAMFPFLLGRFGQVTQNLNNGKDLQPLPQGSGAQRNYRYYETEVYLQDTWKARTDLTLTYGLRYQYYSVPYETNGFEAIQNTDFATFFNQRAAAAAQGRFGTDTIPLVSYTPAGKANHGPGLYHPDWKDFAPRFSFAYNPAATQGWLGRLLGDRKTVLRGGFGIVFDHPITNALNFEQDRNSYIYKTSTTTSFGNLADPAANLAGDPRFASLTALPPGLNPPPVITVPFKPFVDENGVPTGEADVSFNYAIDPNIKTPYNITYTFGIQRELPGNFQLDVTYFARLGRRLLAQSDAGQVIDFKDPTSQHFLVADFADLSRQLRAGADAGSVNPEPFFENQVFPGATSVIADALGGLVVRGDLADTVQALNFFGVLAPGIGLSPQFDTNVYVTNQSYSNYNGLLATLHKKLSHDLQFDLNYTYSHSIDNVSTSANSFFAEFVCDVSNLGQCRGNSDFDVRHIVTFNGIYDLPFGRGKWIGGNASNWLNHIIGNWRISGINTWRSGFAFRTHTDAFPIGFAFDTPGIFNGDNAAIKSEIHVDSTGAIQFFADPAKANAAFRGPLGLEGGTRNNLHGPHLSTTDLLLAKTFKLERVSLEFRAEAYNAFNHVNFALPNAAAMDISSTTGSPFGVITGTTTSPRVMQFGLEVNF